MSWQNFPRTSLVAMMAAAALSFATHVKAEGGEGASVIFPQESGEASQGAPMDKRSGTATVADEDGKPTQSKKSAKAAARNAEKDSAKRHSVLTSAAPPEQTSADTEKPELAGASGERKDAIEQNGGQSANPAPVRANAAMRIPRSDIVQASIIKPLIARHASENNLPFELADAIVRLESRYNASARSGPNMGLTQINFLTAKSLGYKGEASGLFDAEINLRYGLRYLAQAYKLAGGDTCGTILRYQFGHRTQIMTGASRLYCAKVMTLIAAAE
jgi:soluble lytic murein transglycosylase-like protein